MLSISSGRGAAADTTGAPRGHTRTAQTHQKYGQPALVTHDELVALTFRTMRLELGVSQATLARRVGTSVTTIEALEAGLIRGLPGWSELKRIIAAYAAMMHTDLSPIENRLKWYFDLPGPNTPARGRDSHTGKASVTKPVRRAGGLSLRRILTLGLPLLTALGVATAAQTSPQTLFAVADTMPASMRSIAQASLALITPVNSYRAEGLTWIDAADPRTRKGDRLKAR
jgi:DNA-binding XRE family transcriptional regulator